MRSNPCRKISLLGIAHPVEGKKIILGTEGHLGMGRIQGLTDEEMAIYGIVMYFFKKLG